ncbi:MAG: selenide, water dikinase SelD, partial [Gemmatimonadota bacterium]
MPDDRLLIGLEGPDDAAVYLLDGGQALVATLDFFTPLVDGAEDFGAIAAANALSDLYAMHARPIFALNVLAIPAGRLPDEVVGAILRGAAEVCREAGIAIAGGHSIDDPEPKYGLVAIGLADPKRLYRRAGAREGDALVLGKALGTGVITTGIKSGRASAESAHAAIRSMRRLNREATAILDGFEVHAATDVSGFGLLGHLREMCFASGLSAVVRAGAPAILSEALELADRGCVPGGTERNRRAVEPLVDWAEDVEEARRIV